MGSISAPRKAPGADMGSGSMVIASEVLGTASSPCGGRILLFIGIALFIWLLLVVEGYTAGRLFYDDELDPVMTSRLSFGEIVQKKYREPDPHPPGHFLYLKAWFSLFGRSESVAYASSLLPSALSLALLSLVVLRLSPSAFPLALGLLVLNPMLLLQASAARWYPLWTLFIAAAVCVLLWSEARGRHAVTSAILVVAAFYVQYLALVPAAAIGLWLLMQRRIRDAALFAVVVAAGVLPWVPALLRQLGGAPEAQFLGMHIRWINVGYVGFTLLAGETTSPLRPLSWLLVLGTAVPVLLLHLGPAWRDRRQQLLLLLVCSALLLALATGLGLTKARSFAFYSGATSLLVALAVRRGLAAEARWPRRLAGLALVCVLALDAAAYANLARGRYYHKQGLSDPTAELVDQIRLWAEERPTIVLTANPVLTYYASRLRAYPQRLRVETFFPEYLPDDRLVEDSPASGLWRLVFIQSFLGVEPGTRAMRLEQFRRDLSARFPERTTISLQQDPEFEAKRTLFPQLRPPAYRFEIEIIPRVPNDDAAALSERFRAIAVAR